MISFHDEMLERWFYVRDIEVSFVKDEVIALANNTTSGWVAYWATLRLGEYFCERYPPDDVRGRQLWVNALLDNGHERLMLDWYVALNPKKLLLDDRAKFQAHFAIAGYPERHLRCDEHLGYVHEAIQTFNNKDILPGYLRRTTAYIENIEDLLWFVKPLYSRNPKKYENLIMTIYDSIICSNTESKPDEIPDDKFNKGVGPRCPICNLDDAAPWQLVKLKSCKMMHIICIHCISQSMGMADPNMRGKCPGQNCDALANRREMEMAGVFSDVIYYAIRERYWTDLRKTKGLIQCRKCLFGAAIGSDPNCVLCKNDTSGKQAGTADFELRLLRGLEASKSANGNGLMRECYYCSMHYMKGNACMTITCGSCHKVFNFNKGPDDIKSHLFLRAGVPQQTYVPRVKGILWNLGVFKRKDGTPLKLGQRLSKGEAAEVLRRAREKQKSYGK